MDILLPCWGICDLGIPNFPVKKKNTEKKKKKLRWLYQICACISWGHNTNTHRPVRSPAPHAQIYCHICCAFYIWAGPHTGVFAATWNALGDGLNRISSDADSIKEMNHTAVNQTFVFGTRMTCPCWFCGEGNVSYVDDYEEKCAGGVLARQRWFVSSFLVL